MSRSDRNMTGTMNEEEAVEDGRRKAADATIVRHTHHPIQWHQLKQLARCLLRPAATGASTQWIISSIPSQSRTFWIDSYEPHLVDLQSVGAARPVATVSIEQLAGRNRPYHLIPPH